LAIATALFFGLGFGRVLQLVHARAWQIEVEPKPMDQLRYAAVLVVLFGLLLLVLLEEKLFSGWSAWLDAAFVPGWIALLVGYFVWAPRMLTHKRLPGRDLLPGASSPHSDWWR
jgi:TRAP-type C4-dicarboxylate transport system permease large subunit